MSYGAPDRNWHHPAIGPHEQHAECRIFLSTSPSSIAWPAVNLCLYVPIYVCAEVTVYALWWENGGTVSGNCCMGLYNEAGDRIVETGVVAQSGTSTPQQPSITPFRIPRGRYWAGLAVSNVTSQFRAWNVNAGVANTDFNKWFCVGEETVTGTQVPTTMNPSASARMYLPLMGLRTISQAL